MTSRRLEFVEGKSSKFWQATHTGTEVTVVYGRIGTDGQTQVKSFDTEADAKKAYDKQVAEKLKKGYADAAASPTAAGGGAGAGASPATGASGGTTPAKAGAKKPAEKVAEGKRAAKKPTRAAAPGPANEDPAATEAPRAPDITEASSSALPETARATSQPLSAPEPTLTLGAADRIAGLLDPIPLPQRTGPQPFDRDACITRLAALGKPDKYMYSLPWERLGLTADITEDEAWFWIKVVAAGSQLKGAVDKAKSMSVEPMDLNQYRGWENHNEGTIAAFYVVLGLDGFCDRVFAHHSPAKQARAIIQQLLPVMDGAQRDALRAAIEARVGTSVPAWATWLLAVLGLDRTSVATQLAAQSPLPPGDPRYVAYSGESTALLRATFGLRDPAAIVAEVERLRAYPANAADARALYAAAGFGAADGIAKGVLAMPSKADAEGLANVLALGKSTAVVEPMLRVMLESKVPGSARQWLDANTAFAIPGLLPLVTAQGAKAEAAASYLRELARAGHADAIDAALSGMDEQVARAVRTKVLSAHEEQHPVAEDSELPEWATRCFGDPAKLTIEPVMLEPEQQDPPARVDVGPVALHRSASALPPYTDPGNPPAFDLEACIARMLSCHTTLGAPPSTYDYWAWEKLSFALPMAPEEGRFWVLAIRTAGYRVTPAQAEKKLRAMRFDEPLDDAPRWDTRPLTGAWAEGGLRSLLAYAHSEHNAGHFADQVVQRVVPSLSPDQRATMLRELLALPAPTTGALLLAQRLGASDADLRAALPRLVRGEHGAASELLRLLYVYEDAETIVREAERVKAVPRNEKEAREWLAATGVLGVPTLGTVATASYQNDRAGLVRALTCVEAPSAAPYMLALRKGTAKEAARQWLENNIAHTVEGLLPLVGTKDKQAAAATDHLRDLCRRGYGWLVERKAGGRADVAKLVLDPRAGLAKPKASDAAIAGRLAPISIKTAHGPRALGPARTATVLAEIRSSSLDAPTPRLALFREHVDEHARDAFAWAVFQSWLQDGASSKERWKMEAVGHLGGDASAIALAKLVRVWPGESQHQRAVLGLECLRAIGTDTALMQIHGISQKVSFKGIKERASECMEGIAQDRGMSRDELADRIIPDGGLDERGSRVFDFGARRFEFVLGDDLKPMVRDEAGKRLPNLPKPNSKDDAELSGEAVAAWKLLKKQVAEVVKTQAVRLEQAMVVGRRWSPDDFETLFVQHPLMVHLVRRMIWAAYDAEGTYLGSFRVADDGTLATVRDETFAYPERTASVGVVHPSHLSADDAPAWGEILADYEIVPPFAQLGRPTYALTEEESKGTIITRFEKDEVEGRALVFGLEALGWTRGRPQDGGAFCAHHKTFGGVTAVATYRDGCWVGTGGEDWTPQKVDAVGFTTNAGEAEDGFFSWTYTKGAVPLREVDPVIVSEVLHDLTRLVEKGKQG
ncbi:MAG: DUF4132 domain-containing protein [Polyangiales bacterium]